MAAFVLTDAEIVVNGVDLSAFVLSATLNYQADLQEDTAMGDGTRTRLAGLKDWSLEVNFKQDFDSGSVDDTLYSLIGAASFTVTVMANKTAGIGTTNPRYSGPAVLESYPILSNSVGELAQASVTFQAAGTLTRSTS